MAREKVIQHEFHLVLLRTNYNSTQVILTLIKIVFITNKIKKKSRFMREKKTQDSSDFL